MAANLTSGTSSDHQVSEHPKSEQKSGSRDPKQHQQQQLLFMMLIQQYQQIAQAGLGQVEHPTTGELEVDLSSARFAIDTLGMLKEFTRGNITKEMSEYIEAILSPLQKELEAIG